MDRALPIDPELEKGYNVSLSRSDFSDLFSAWAGRSEKFRAGADARLNCVYGDGRCDRIDLFRCGDSSAPLLVFIHGGYWQRGDKSVFSFIAEYFRQCPQCLGMSSWVLRFQAFQFFNCFK